MRGAYVPCAVCGSLDAERVSPRDVPVAGDQIVQAVVICRRCGFVYRNPTLTGSQDGPAAGSNSADGALAAAAGVAKHLTLDAGDLFLEIECGIGLFAEALASKFPMANGVLLDSDVKRVDQAKRRNLRAAVLPSAFDEADLPENTFAFVAERFVDHRSGNHRHDIERIVKLLRDGGMLYVERSLFVDGWTDEPGTNNWFGRDQFVEYLREFVDVVDVADQADGARAVYGKRRAGGEKQLPGQIPNRYAEHLGILSSRI